MLIKKSDRKSINPFLDRVLATQAIMGALVSILSFFIARFCLSVFWSALTGLLTALSPHLIAMDGYLLTESLFTLVMILGMLALMLSWKNKNGIMAVIAGIFITLSFYTRAINIFLLLFLSPIFFIDSKSQSFFTKKIWVKQLSFLLLGYIIVTFSHFVFEKQFDVHNKSADTYVSTKAAWGDIVRGAYPGFFYKDGIKYGNSAWRVDPEYKKMLENKKYAFTVLKNRFTEHPFSFLKWYLGGKIFFMWHWDNIYNGDVYIYPMKRKGFQENYFLYSIYKAMRYIHWPLFILTLISPIIVLILWRYNKLPLRARMLFVPILVFAYTAGILTILQPLPRYSIPLRPFAYIMAIFSLSYLIQYFKIGFHLIANNISKSMSLNRVL
ncbi:MAG: glycosyltransferase family 39 protein [Thermodesulfobacteriota bacterium]|nr:glycosyltransferase family 39 protein [Thermodesulfobacteriota bacterium]